MASSEALAEPVSEPLTLFFHQDESSKYANLALEMAARFYDLKVEKYFSPDYVISYFKLLDAQSQRFRQDHLFSSGINLVRALMSYKKEQLSEPETTTKVNITQLKAALTTLSEF
ncbi:MAG: hypothetical protein IH840_09945 [Candidatus Heimdallarchaeota archaeon]|nr:hypothetical protein [Candidatus Heimdallarchaeota archaeon]